MVDQCTVIRRARQKTQHGSADSSSHVSHAVLLCTAAVALAWWFRDDGARAECRDAINPLQVLLIPGFVMARIDGSSCSF